MYAITKLVAVWENPGWTLTNQDGDYLSDAPTMEKLIDVAKKYAEDHDLEEMTIPLT